MYNVNCTPTLIIGKQGENNAEQIAVDFAPWVAEYGEGVISARLRRPKDSTAYPVILTAEGTTATWTVSATDTQYAGAGSLQLVYIVGDVVAKSVIWPVRVLPSLEEGEAPEPYESWLDTLEGLAADTQENARDAAASAADAAQSARDAAESAASITGLTAVAETLPEGSEASASFDSTTDTLTLGIPRGDTGATGPAGPAGPKGDTGADGFSPSATVTKQDGNITITITDKDGTTSETLEVDDALDETSENPVQNAAIVEAMRSILPVDTASGAIASFPDGADDVPVKSLVVQIEPIQEGSGDPSPDNVRPISGHTGVKVEKRGKNLLDPNEITVTSNNLYSYQTNKFLLKKGVTYVYGSTVSRSGLYIIGDGIDERTYERQAPLVYTPTADVLVSFNVYWADSLLPSGGLTKDMIYLNVATDQGYEPYQGETIPVSWKSEAGTVYGGELDLVSGKLTSRMAMVDLGTLTWTYIGKFYAPIQGAKIPATQQTVPNVLCSIYSADSYYRLVNAIADKVITIDRSGNAYVRDSSYSNATTFKAAMNGVQLAYELAEPIEYTLTPQEVSTFLGVNNIWNDCGDTEVTYRANIQKFIEKKVNG